MDNLYLNVSYYISSTPTTSSIIFLCYNYCCGVIIMSHRVDYTRSGSLGAGSLGAGSLGAGSLGAGSSGATQQATYVSTCVTNLHALKTNLVSPQVAFV